MRRLLLVLLFPLAAQADNLETPRQLLDRFDPSALGALQAVVKAEPRNVEALRLLGIAQLRAGDPAAAVDSLERATRLEPGRAELFHLLGQAYGSNINNVGTLSKLSYAGKIRGSFQKAVELDPDLIDARSALVQYYLQAPGIAGGSVAKAQAEAVEIARRNPGRGHMARAQLLASEGKHDDAIAAYAAAVVALPEYAPAWMSHGLALHQAGRVDEALDAFEAMQRELPEAGQGWYQFGRLALLGEKRLAEGEAALRHYLTLPRAAGLPEPKYAHLRLGQILSKRGQAEAARAEIGRALALDRDFAEARKALAEI